MANFTQYFVTVGRRNYLCFCSNCTTHYFYVIVSEQYTIAKFVFIFITGILTILANIFADVVDAASSMPTNVRHRILTLWRLFRQVCTILEDGEF